METSVPQLGEAIKRVLQDRANQLGVSTGFIQRVREFTGATFAQTMILGQMQEGEIAMSDLASFARQVGVNVSAQAIDKRFTKKTATFFGIVSLAKGRLSKPVFQAQSWAPKNCTLREGVRREVA